MLVLIHAVHMRRAAKRFTFPFGELVVAMVAFLGWVAALPDSPFFDLAWYRGHYAAGLLLILAAVMPYVAELLGVKPADDANA